MKKIVLVITCFLFIVGCSFTNNTPTKKVESHLMKYKDLDETVLSDLDLASESEGLTTKQKENYVKAMKRQYSNMKYEVTNEQVNGDEAVVTAKITVYDLHKVRSNANKYAESNRSEFLIDGIYSNEKFVNYELDEMLKAEDTIDYTIDFTVTKDDNDKWVVDDLDTVTKQKLHGIYNYES